MIGKRGSMLWSRHCLLLIIVFLCSDAFPGVFQDSLFRTYSSVSNLINQDSLRLSVRQWLLSMSQTISRPNGENSRTPDVVGFGDGRFVFFWSDSVKAVHAFDTVYKRELRVTPGGFDTSSSRVLMTYSARPPLKYLHGGRGGLSENFASFIYKGATFDSIMLVNDLSKVGLSLSTGSSVTRSSMCYWKSDTFLVAYQTGDDRIYVKRVYSGASLSQAPRTDTMAVAVNYPADAHFYISNSSMAADNAFNVLTVWAVGTGTAGFPKTLRCRAYDNTLSKGDSADFTDHIDSVGFSNFYDDAPVTAYGHGAFGLVSWSPSGILFHSVKIGPLDTATVTIEPGPFVRFPCVASNGSYIAVSWIKDTLGSTQVKVGGVRDTIRPGYVPFSSVQNQVRFSSPWQPSTKIPGKTTSTFALNCSMDSLGSIAATWPIDSFVNARLWANRGVRSDSGWWISQSTRFMDNSSDSAYLLPDSIAVGDEVLQPPNNDSTRMFVRVGIDSADQSAWQPWTRATDSAALAANTKGTCRFFQYKILLYRGEDTLGTPVVRKSLFRWNAKPSFLPLDSVHVNGKKIPGMAFGAVDTVFSRSDTVSVYFTLRDADATDTLRTHVTGYRAIVDSLNTLYPASGRATRIQCLPYVKSDTTINLSFSAADKIGWSATGNGFSIHTRNSLPQLHVYALDTNHTGKTDTFEITSTKAFNLEQNDSMGFMYKCYDTNDYQPQFRAFAVLDGAKIDSASQGTNRNYTFKGSTGRASGDTIVFSFADPDTTVMRTVIFRVNHFPVISSLSTGTRVIHNGDTISVGIGAVVSFAVNAKDTDVAFWDKLSYRYTRKTKDSVTTAAAFSFPVSRTDSSLLVRVTDSFGKTDSLRFFMKSPWFATDTSANKAYQLAKEALLDSVAFIIGSGQKDSIGIPLVNTGDDTLKLTSLSFKGAASGWISVRVPGQTGSGLYDSLASGKIDTVSIAPGSTRTVIVLLDASRLSGDGIMHDTIIFATNDFNHPYDTIPVTMEYDDLPKIASISIDYSKGTPYWLSKKAVAKASAYAFPPSAKISIHFTEPMDTASAAGAISAYSLFDKRVTNTPPPIAFDRTWTGNDSVLSLSPRYTAPSPYFNGFQPPPKFFIPGDSILLTVASSITDQAKTPHGPNGLDVHENAIRIANADTMIPFRVDSITYTIDSVYPKDKDAGISASTQISLTFSSPPLPTTVDTSKTNNRCLIVHSKYFGSAPVIFSSITVSGSTATFRLAKQFFYGDTVTCYYRARWVTDSLGYPVVLNNSGIPIEMFDTSSTANDKQWSFAIKNLVHTGFLPQSNDTGILPSTTIAVRFADTIPSATVDTSKTGNRQLVVYTAFSKGAHISFDSVRTKGTSVIYYPVRRFFYGDTVYCSYQGLMTKDSLRYSINLSGSQSISTNDRAQWHFTIKNIKLVSAKPDSASRGSIQPVITMKFSDPIFSGTFDRDTLAGNRSFSLTSSFASDSTFSFRSIVLSPDSTQVTIKPKGVFFSNDSIHCFFKGFAKTFRYDTIVNLPTDSSGVMAGHDWYFFTEITGFYTYPNPYKPGIDPRHCRNAATDPCGIWFTNLHLLRKGVGDIIIKIFGMNANPVYNTQSAGINIHFSVNDPSLKPQWKWDTKNQRGEFVASGLYFYVITDLKGNVLIKGKLMIVR